MMAATQLKPLRGLEDFLQKPGTTSQQIATMWGSAVEASNEIFSATIAWNNGAEERNVRVADIQDVKDKLGLNIGMGKLIEKYQDVANNKGIAYTFKLTDVPFRGKIYSVPPVLR